MFVGVEDVVFCSNCEEEIHLISGGVLKKRTSLLPKLHHGAIPICVSDFVRDECGLDIPCDGFSDGIFCVNKKHSFTR